MDLPELRTNLRYLVEKYIPDEEQRVELHILINSPGRPPVKAIMAEVSLSDRPGDRDDAALFKDIAFHYL